ncbi:MAG: YihY/virulence factor BrkB family protein [Clostridia bacterium]|jgi:membrane protein|nr:YihY/virulence factor BrkB family protein [Clostridia bacterium]
MGIVIFIGGNRMGKVAAKFIQFLKLLVLRIIKNDIPGTSAQMSYYLVMAFFPFIIFLITTLSYSNLFEYSLPDFLARIMPENTADFLINIIDELLEARSGSLLSVSMLTTIFFASKGVNAIIIGINRSFLVTENRGFFKKTAISFIFTILFAFSINFLFIFIIMGQVITELVVNFLGITDFSAQLWGLIRIGITLGFIFLVISFVYIYFPNLKPRLKIKDVIWGSIFSTLFWLISSFLFSFYVNNFSNYTLIYGSIAGIIVFLLWLFISSIILLTGAEINALLKTMNNR